MKPLAEQLVGHWNPMPWRRRVSLVVVTLLLAWTVAASLHQALWSWRYWRVDPWSEHSPVQWAPTSNHVATLGALLRRALAVVPSPHSPNTDPGADGPRPVLAISPDPALAEQGFYFYLWAAYLLPEWDVRRVTRPEEGLEADYWLAFGRPDHTVGSLADGPRLEWLTTEKSSVLPPALLYRVQPDGNGEVP